MLFRSDADGVIVRARIPITLQSGIDAWRDATIVLNTLETSLASSLSRIERSSWFNFVIGICKFVSVDICVRSIS